MMEGLCEAKLKKQIVLVSMVLNSEKLVLLCGRTVISRSERNVARMLIIGLSRQNRSPPKSVRPDRFWQKNLPKVVRWTTFCCQNQSGRTNFGSQNWSPLANFGPPTLLFPILHYRAIPLGTCIGSYSYS